jgi:ferredoxin
VASGNAPKNLCKPGGADCLKKISEILGEASDEFVREIAYVHCNGNCNATEDKYEYIGTQSCAAVERFYNGKGKCIYGCAGLGDCVKVCDFGAINIVNGVAKVTPAKCTACGKCIAACPNRMISLRRETEKVLLQCNSKDTGKVTRQACKNGCIGCKICEKKCPEGAITVSENRAVIDYNKCTSCGTCVDACPQKCLKKLPNCNVV